MFFNATLIDWTRLRCGNMLESLCARLRRSVHCAETLAGGTSVFREGLDACHKIVLIPPHVDRHLVKHA